MKIRAKELMQISFPEGPAFGLALKPHTKGSKAEYMKKLQALLAEPSAFLEDEEVSDIAKALMEDAAREPVALRTEEVPYKVYGAKGIEDGALQQMQTAMKLPITDSGALMPDAHQGYGLPIGGVLATKGAVIPYGVGVDIGCRMCLSIYDIPVERMLTDHDKLQKMLQNNTQFGRATFRNPKDHAIFERETFKEIEIAKQMRDRAYKQIGTSGGGNHFVEFGVVKITEAENEFKLPPGTYMGLLSHSGSRGLGASIARHYTDLAMQQTKLPKEAKHLAWLDMETDAGKEYWEAMTLAGDYASACHHQIHERMAVGLRTKPIAMVENHHNFAWKELNAQGEEVIVHRKGATPAGKGVLGVIPGSMTAPGYIVRGRGIVSSINSAAHGAGRVMSRTRAKQSLVADEVKAHLATKGVTVIGSGLDEAPQAYKNINEVMSHQQELVDILGSFTPKIVRMCGDKGYFEVD